jgi:predicted DNA-binding protein
MVKTVGTGLRIGVSQMERLKVLMAADRRTLGFLVRDAIDMYLNSRRNEINELKRRGKKKASWETDRAI